MTFSLFIGDTDILWDQYSYEANAHVTTDSIVTDFSKKKKFFKQMACYACITRMKMLDHVFICEY